MDLIYRLKDVISHEKEMIKNYLFYGMHRKGSFIDDNNKNIVLMGTPEYGNLGDHLIAYAELKILEDKFGSNCLLEITENDIRYRFRKVKKAIDKNAILFLQGGGNISDVWSDQEKIRKKILSGFSSNKIIIMPQTIYISKSGVLPELLKKYDDRVLLCAREKRTYTILINNKKKTLMCPDAALYLWDYCEKYRDNHQRNAIGICIRKDKESLYENVEERLIESIHKEGYETRVFTTVKNEYISVSSRKNVIEKMILEIANFRLIITDRLHAMIMAYLTGTPCIAMANANGKIEGCYEWINNADNICFVENLDEAIEQIVSYIDKENSSSFQYGELFNKIFDII